MIVLIGAADAVGAVDENVSQLTLTIQTPLHQLTARSHFMGRFCALKVFCGWVHREFEHCTNEYVDAHCKKELSPVFGVQNFLRRKLSRAGMSFSKPLPRLLARVVSIFCFF